MARRKPVVDEMINLSGPVLKAWVEAHREQLLTHGLDGLADELAALCAPVRGEGSQSA